MDAKFFIFRACGAKFLYQNAYPPPEVGGGYIYRTTVFIMFSLCLFSLCLASFTIQVSVISRIRFHQERNPIYGFIYSNGRCLIKEKEMKLNFYRPFILHQKYLKIINKMQQPAWDYQEFVVQMDHDTGDCLACALCQFVGRKQTSFVPSLFYYSIWSNFSSVQCNRFRQSFFFSIYFKFDFNYFAASNFSIPLILFTRTL